MNETEKPRKIPGPVTRCRICRHPVVLAITVATPLGPGGKPTTLDLTESPTGTVAAFQKAARARLHARPLEADESIDVHNEYRATLHEDTCGAGLADEVEDFLRELAGDQ